MKQNEIEEIAARVSATARAYAPGYRPTAAQTADAASVMAALVDSTAIYGVTLEHFDGVADFPRLAIQLVQRRDARD